MVGMDASLQTPGDRAAQLGAVMELDETLQVPLGAGASEAGWTGSAPVGRRATGPPAPLGRSLGDDADGLIRELFDCGFTIAGVRGRHDVGADLSDQLIALMTVLDIAIRDIRHALYHVDAA
jgi:hypothetical protein